MFDPLKCGVRKNEVDVPRPSGNDSIVPTSNCRPSGRSCACCSSSMLGDRSMPIVWRARTRRAAWTSVLPSRIRDRPCACPTRGGQARANRRTAIRAHAGTCRTVWDSRCPSRLLIHIAAQRQAIVFPTQIVDADAEDRAGPRCFAACEASRRTSHPRSTCRRSPTPLTKYLTVFGKPDRA